MSENQESTWQPKTRAEIAAEESKKIEKENIEKQLADKNTDHRAAFDSYQSEHKDEIIEGGDDIQPNKTVAEINAEEFEKIKKENELNKIKEEINNTKQQSSHVAAFDAYQIKEQEVRIAEEEKQAEAKEAEKVKLATEEAERSRLEVERIKLAVKEAESLKSTIEEAEKVKLATEEAERARLEAERIELKTREAKEERDARAERAVENLKSLYLNKEDLYSQKQKRSGLLSKLKGLISSNDNSKIDEEYKSVYGEYEEALKEVQSLTGKSEEQVIREYLNFNEGENNQVETINGRLDQIETNVEESERGLIGEVKYLYENFEKLSNAEQAKIIVGGALVGVAVIYVGAGLGAGALGMGLMQATGHAAIITNLSTEAYIALEGGTAAAVVGGGSFILERFREKIHNLTKERPEVENNNPPEDVAAETPENSTVNEETRIDLESLFRQAFSQQETNLEADPFKEVRNINDLYQVLDKLKSIEGISSVEIKKTIDRLRRTKKEEINYNLIPESFGLRKKFEELIINDVMGVGEIK